jgi:hypothetical protein
MMETLRVPNNVNVMAVPTAMLPLRVGKKNNAYILVVLKKRPSVEVKCGARHWCMITVDMLPSGGIKLEQIEPEPVHFGVSAVNPPLMLVRQLPHGRFKLAFRFSDEVGKLNAGELVAPAIIESPSYLVFERVGNNEFRLTNKEPEAFVITYSYELNSRVQCAGIDVIESELLAYEVCSTCCATLSYSLLLGIGKDGQRVKIRQKSAYYREKLADVEKTFAAKKGKLVETIDVSVQDIL